MQMSGVGCIPPSEVFANRFTARKNYENAGDDLLVLSLSLSACALNADNMS